MRAVFGAMTGRDKNGAYKKPGALKIVLITLLYVYLFAAFTFASVCIAMAIGTLFIISGEPEIYFAMINILAFSLIFLFSIFETKSELFDCKDNNLLLSMPIPSGSIVIARILVVLIYNLITEAIIVIPAAIVYLALSGGELLGFFGLLITGLFISLAATALSAAVGYLVAMIAKKMKNKTFITLLFSLLFMGAYFVGYSALLGVEGDGTEVDIAAIAAKLAFLKPIGAASMLSPLPIIILIVICGGISYAAYRIISNHYIGIVTQDHSLKRTEYKAAKMKHASPIVALTKKELYKIVSSATYMLNAAIGVVIEIGVAILAAVKIDGLKQLLAELSAELGMASADSAVAAVLAAGTLLMASTVILSASSVSLEGKNLWILKSMPANARSILSAKALAHIIVAVPPAVIAVLIIGIAISLSPLYILLTALCAVVVNVFCAFLGVILNTCFPKFVYENEAQPIKQSLSSFLAMFILMIAGMIFLFGGFFMALMSLGLLFTVLFSVFFTGLAIGSYFIMAYPCAKRFEGFSVA